jgi:hypothetical protein
VSPSHCDPQCEAPHGGQVVVVQGSGQGGGEGTRALVAAACVGADTFTAWGWKGGSQAGADKPVRHMQVV